MSSNTEKKNQYILQDQKKWIIINIVYKPPKSTGCNIYYGTNEDHKAQDYWQTFIEQKKKTKILKKT